jgi:hypothetical protein
VNNNALLSLFGLHQQRLQGVDKPAFHDAWNPYADQQMGLMPLPGHPGYGDKNNMHPDDVQPPPSYDTQNSPPRQDLSALARLLNIG